jgi:uncharacterized protein YraI
MNIRNVNRFALAICASLALGLLWLAAAQASVAAQQRFPVIQQNGNATATALIKMQQSIFATQTAIALTLQPPTTTPLPTSTPRPASTPRPTSTAAPTSTSRPTKTVQPTSTASVPNMSATAAAATVSAVRSASATRAANATRTSGLPTATLAAPSVTVVDDSINLRSGPGANYPVIGLASNGAVYPVLGQAANCAWLQITADSATPVWITGAPVYTRLNGACSSVPVAQAPAAAASTATSTPPAQSAPAITTQPTSSPTTVPAPAAGGPTAITPLSPAAGSDVGGSVSFAWAVDAPLGPGQVFELVFWFPGAGPNDGRSLTAASAATAIQVNLDNLGPGARNWGVWLAQAEPYARLRFLGVGGVINVVSNSGGSGESSSDGGDSSSPADEHGGEK